MLRRVLSCACLLSLPVLGGTPLQDELQRYNHLQLSPEAQVAHSTDNGEVAAFADYTFTCRPQSDHLPKETPAARAAFERFVAEFEAHPQPTTADKRRRLDLLAKAIAAKSWRAEYVDAMWGIWSNRSDPAEAQPFLDRLVRLAETGNPAALHGVLTWTNGMYDDMPQRVRLLKAAIEGGNPQVLASVGYNLGTHSRTLRPMALQMLACAAAQGEASAYNGMGRIAWLEGRWVDAYRAWERGANLGCEDCMMKFDELPRMVPEADQLTQQLRALRAHYSAQPLFEISHLIPLRRPLPAWLELHIGDAELLAFLKARIERYGLP